jgi:transcriptional regulator with XRE-family HTH domain
VERPSRDRLRRYILGLSLVKTARAIGVDTSTLSLVERGLYDRPDVEAKLDAFLSQQEKLAKLTPDLKRPARAVR